MASLSARFEAIIAALYYARTGVVGAIMLGFGRALPDRDDVALFDLLSRADDVGHPGSVESRADLVAGEKTVDMHGLLEPRLDQFGRGFKHSLPP